MFKRIKNYRKEILELEKKLIDLKVAVKSLEKDKARLERQIHNQMDENHRLWRDYISHTEGLENLKKEYEQEIKDYDNKTVADFISKIAKMINDTKVKD